MRKPSNIFLAFILSLYSGLLFGQDDFLSGTIQLPEGWNNVVYLSVKADYRSINIISEEDIVAQSQVDEYGHFSFPKKVFASSPKLYQLHVSENANEIEIFISDFNKKGIGYNFSLF